MMANSDDKWAGPLVRSLELIDMLNRMKSAPKRMPVQIDKLSQTKIVGLMVSSKTNGCYTNFPKRKTNGFHQSCHPMKTD